MSLAGPQAYDVDDADRFFGRDADVAACLEILARGSFVALVGPPAPASPRSSAPACWRPCAGAATAIVLVTPGPRPLQSLTALRRGRAARHGPAVDQGEEVFSLCDDLEERRDFLERLAEEARRRPCSSPCAPTASPR